MRHLWWSSKDILLRGLYRGFDYLVRFTATSTVSLRNEMRIARGVRSWIAK
jgi:hypothetical protein